MIYNKKEVYSSGDIADILGFNDYHRVSNYLNKIKATNVTSKGNTRYYDEDTKKRVITYFDSLLYKGSRENKKDKIIEELHTQLLSIQKENIQKLNEQQEVYERLLVAKDENIKDLKDTIANLLKQQEVTNSQIKELTIVTKQAQSLNLIDKKTERLQTPIEDEEPKGWFKRHFGK